MNPSILKNASTPWKVVTYPNSPPFIQDAEGRVVAQVAISLIYGETGYKDGNERRAELIVEGINYLADRVAMIAPAPPIESRDAGYADIRTRVLKLKDAFYSRHFGDPRYLFIGKHERKEVEDFVRTHCSYHCDTPIRTFYSLQVIDVDLPGFLHVS